ncbi:hypothetical protein ACXR0O_03515 [Verrucomicrobiota bacterium sgz303538]
MEKQVFPEPAEEFVDDQSIPSKSKQSEKSEKSSSPQRMVDVKPAGHQDNKPENFEPGVEG